MLPGGDAGVGAHNTPTGNTTLTYAALLEMSQTSSSQQAAIQTLTQSIAMMDAIEGKDAKLMQAPIRLIIPHIVESAMILGYVPWRVNGDGVPEGQFFLWDANVQG